MIQQDKLRQLAAQGCPVYYFYSEEAYLVRAACTAVRAALGEENAEETVFDEPAPSLESLVAAAGTISFFGTRRVVVLPALEPGQYSESDAKEFGGLLAAAENAVFVLGSTVKAERGKLQIPARMSRLVETCRKLGYAEELARPTEAQLRQLLTARAAALGAQLSDTVAKRMIEQSGDDPFLLENEVDKLCALANYGTVTAGMVAELGTPDLDTDVFEMVRAVTAQNATQACRMLRRLLQLQNEPVQIAGALTGSYVDLYRVRLGQLSHHDYTAVHKDFGYRGSPYRLKYSLDTALHYTLPQLENCLLVLQELDRDLKGSPVDGGILLETALCRLGQAGGRA
jgi:DNA polymerase-3 subunit delta